LFPIESVNLLHFFHFFNKILREGIFCVTVIIARVTFFLRDQRISRIIRAERSETLTCLSGNVSRTMPAFFPRRSSRIRRRGRACNQYDDKNVLMKKALCIHLDRLVTRWSYWILKTYFIIFYVSSVCIMCHFVSFYIKKFMIVA